MEEVYKVKELESSTLAHLGEISALLAPSSRLGS